jgi:hypothetical protein
MLHGPGRATAVMFSWTLSERKMLRSCGAKDVALLRHPAHAQYGAHLRRQRADFAAAERDRSREAARHADQRVQ